MVTGRLGSGAQLAVGFGFVSLSDPWSQLGMGATPFEDWVGGREWGQAFLPVVVAASEFGLGGGA